MSNIMPFIYEGETVIRTIRQDESVWFVAKDVCKALGIKLVHRAVANFPEGDSHKMTLPSSSGEQEYLIVNEPGFYRLVFRSNKPAAKAFSDWVYNEVLPSIRKTGSYVGGSGADQSSLRGSNEPLDITQQQVLADKLLLLSESNKFYGYAQSLSYLLSIIKVRDVSELKQSHLPHIGPIIDSMYEYQHQVHSVAVRITQVLESDKESMLEEELENEVGLNCTGIIKTALSKLCEYEYVVKERKYDEREERKLFKRTYYRLLRPLSDINHPLA